MSPPGPKGTSRRLECRVHAALQSPTVAAGARRDVAETDFCESSRARAGLALLGLSVLGMFALPPLARADCSLSRTDEPAVATTAATTSTEAHAAGTDSGSSTIPPAGSAPTANGPTAAAPAAATAPTSASNPVPGGVNAGAGAAPPDDSIHISSEGAEVNRSGDAVLRGKVQVRQGDRTVTSEDATYDAGTESVSASGNVELKDSQMTVRGKAAQVAQSGAASFDQATFQLNNGTARGEAATLQVDQSGHVALHDVRYTTCPLGNEDWLLKASTINVDEKEHLGSARDVRLDFKGVPILYTPYLSFPVDNQRKSGFLFPTFGTSSTNGTELSVPWYWNIAPNYDATLTSTFYSKRGLDVGTEFRYLTDSSHGTLQAQYLPHDDNTGGDRSLVQFQDTTDLASHLRFTADATNVSDTEWFEDFGRTPDATSVTYLNRIGQLTYQDRYWTVIGRAQNYQTIDLTTAPRDRPYTILPQLVVSTEFPEQAFGLTPALYAEYVNFDRSVGVTGQRLDLAPEIRMPLRTGGMFLEPALAWRYTGYQLSHLDPAESPGLTDRSPSRSAPVFSVDTGMVFERDSGSHGQRLQTLEPRLLYLYVPYRNQNNLPVFDTDTPDLNLVQLFSTNRFVGPDRLGDANQLSMGLTSRLLDAHSGQQFLAATVGQSYYFSNPQVTLPGQVPENANSSDIIGQVSLSAYKNWNVRLGMQWDPHAGEREKSEVRFQYLPAHDSVINVSYRYQRDLFEQVDVSTAWPVSKNWSAYGRMVYSLLEDQTIERFVGFEYRSCCWRVRLVSRRYVSRTQGQESSLQLQLELNGLSSVGESTDAFLERSIRGYSIRPPTP